jgi:hypothetical protein
MSGLSGSTGWPWSAAQLAVDDLNSGKPVIAGEPVLFKLLAQDDRADPRTGELIADYFVKSKVAAVVGHWNSGVGIPAAHLCRCRHPPRGARRHGPPTRARVCQRLSYRAARWRGRAAHG